MPELCTPCRCLISFAAAAIALIYDMYAAGEVNSPGGYLRGMVQKAQDGDLHCDRSFYGRARIDTPAMKIESIAHKGLRRFFETGNAKGMLMMRTDCERCWFSPMRQRT